MANFNSPSSQSSHTTQSPLSNDIDPFAGLDDIDLEFLDAIELTPTLETKTPTPQTEIPTTSADATSSLLRESDMFISKLTPRSDFDFRTEDEVLDELKEQLLTEKEKKSEEFIRHFMTNFDENDFEASVKSADLSHQERLQQAQRKMAQSSVILAHKYQPLIKEYVAAQEQQLLNEKFAIIKATPGKLQDMAEKYKQCFTTWVNAKDEVNIKVRDKKEIGNVDVIDAFTLVFFATITSRRQSGDQLLQLVVSGQTSCGKTMIFESPLLDVAHVLTTEKGVSRFNCDSKSTMLLHDINLDMLVKGGDSGNFQVL